MQRLNVTGLPDVPSAAAALFYSEWLGQAQAILAKGDALGLIFPPAGHQHTSWRLSAVQTLARESAPLRVNGVASDDPKAIAEALAYLAAADGVTGQYFPLDSDGAG